MKIYLVQRLAKFISVEKCSTLNLGSKIFTIKLAGKCLKLVSVQKCSKLNLAQKWAKSGLT